MELFQLAEQQSSELQQSGSSVIWLGLALLVVWLAGAGHVPVASVDSILAGFTAILQAIF
jgi:hypothetical protein